MLLSPHYKFCPAPPQPLLVSACVYECGGEDETHLFPRPSRPGRKADLIPGGSSFALLPACLSPFHPQPLYYSFSLLLPSSLSPFSYFILSYMHFFRFFFLIFVFNAFSAPFRLPPSSPPPFYLVNIFLGSIFLSLFFFILPFLFYLFIFYLFSFSSCTC